MVTGLGGVADLASGPHEITAEETMALYDPFTMKKQQLSRYTTDFARCRARLTQPEYDAIINWINGQIDAIAQGEEITDSSWLPGHDWSGTPLDPLYAACGADEKLAGMYWGVLLWNCFVEHELDWFFKTKDRTEDEKETGKKYWRRH
jgi:hypothetical protein